MKIKKTVNGDESTLEIDTEASPYKDQMPRLPTEEEYDIIRGLLDIPHKLDVKSPQVNFTIGQALPTATLKTVYGLEPVDHDRETFEKLVRDEEKIRAQRASSLLSPETAAEMIGDPPPPIQRHTCGHAGCEGTSTPHSWLNHNHSALADTLAEQDSDDS